MLIKSVEFVFMAWGILAVVSLLVAAIVKAIAAVVQRGKASAAENKTK